MPDSRLRATVNVTLAKPIDAVDLANNPTITTVTTTVTVPGVKANQMYLVALANADLDVGLLLQGVVYAEADDQLIIRTVNPTIAGINPAAATIYVIGL
jgi:hypothetical protein